MLTRSFNPALLALLLVFVSTLQACSGQSAVIPRRQSGGSISGTIMQGGTVVLPTGSGIAYSSLNVKNSLGTTKPANDGTFTLNQFPGGPQFAFVTDSSGEAILAGFVSPLSPTIDAASTAKVLIYWAAGFYALPSPYRAQIVDAIATQPAFAAVQSAIETSLMGNSDPFSTAMGRINLAAAIKAYVTAFYANPPSSTAQAIRNLSASRPSAVTVNQTGALSGITAVSDTPNGVHFVNTFRRLAQAYIDEDSFVDGNNVRTSKHVADVVPPERINAVSAIGSVSGGPIAVAQSLLSSSGQYAPVSTPSVSLAVEPGSISTRYNITVIGAGKVNGTVTLTPEQSTARQSLVVQQLIQDILVPFVASVSIPLNSTQLDDYFQSSGGDAQLATIVSTLTGLAPQIFTLTDSGQVSNALVLGLDTIAPSAALQSELLQLVYTFIDTSAGPGVAASAYSTGYSPLYALNVISAVVLGGDVAAISQDIGASNQADVFVVDVSGDSVSMSPLSANLVNGGVQTFTVTAPSAGSGQSLVYDWTNTGAFGHISDGTPGHIDTFESSSNTVTYTANASGNGNDTIGATVFLVAGTSRTQVGNPLSATATVGKCPFAGVFVGPLTDGRFSPPLVSTITLTVTCSPPNIVHLSYTDPSYGSGSYDGTYSGLTVTAGSTGNVTDVYSADYKTITGAEPDALQTDVLTRTSGP
ncbi:MAG TPA: hypothetical protein VGZ00_00195 [Candidatus Baltobacteraceae bacterium]|jgi:hypothetical protein|nr:hypothetical protein [Candidatus Baltobacteraceae bacterium]